MNIVSVVKCKDYNSGRIFDAINAAIELSGGLDGFEKGKKVLLKPNGLGPFIPDKAVTTHPTIVEGAIRVFQERGLEVVIGESSGFSAGGGTKRALKVSGMEECADRRGVQLIDFDKDQRVNVILNGFSRLNHISVAESLVSSDYVVNLPKLKTHGLTGYTGAIKNIFGVIPGRTKSGLHHQGRSLKQFSEILVDIYQAISPSLTIMDAVVGMEGRGPTHGNPKYSGLVLASKNGASLDYIASEIIGFNPLEIEMIKIANQRGIFDEKDIEFLGEGKDEKFNYKKPNIKGIGMFGWISKFMRPSFVADKDDCKKCYQCKDRCPEDAISIGKDKYPVWNMEKCISCYCCDELCPADAVEAKKNIIGKTIDFFTGRYND